MREIDQRLSFHSRTEMVDDDEVVAVYSSRVLICSTFFFNFLSSSRA